MSGRKRSGSAKKSPLNESVRASSRLKAKADAGNSTAWLEKKWMDNSFAPSEKPHKSPRGRRKNSSRSSKSSVCDEDNFDTSLVSTNKHNNVANVPCINAEDITDIPQAFFTDSFVKSTPKAKFVNSETDQKGEDFNDSDTLFAELDLEQEINSPLSKIKKSSKRKCKKQTPCKKLLSYDPSATANQNIISDTKFVQKFVHSNFESTEITHPFVNQTNVVINKECNSNMLNNIQAEVLHKIDLNQIPGVKIICDTTKNNVRTPAHYEVITNHNNNQNLNSSSWNKALPSDSKLASDKLNTINASKNDVEVIPVTPEATGNIGMKFKDRIKKTLQKNAKVATPKNHSHTLQQERMEAVKRELENVQNQYSEHDIGPFYGLPTKVQQIFKKKGIPKLYDWQHECLSLPAVRSGNNLIYSLPTSGGKTLVAEILILRELLCKKKDALLILPFVSIVQEKVRSLTKFALELDFHVEEYAGSKGGFPPKRRRKKQSLYIATIEKANSLVNSFIEEQRIDNVGLVVVDELHMLGEGGSRGAILEMSLTKLMHTASDIQIIGMSATLHNISEILQFLHAELYTNNFRPVELTEHVKLEATIYRIQPRALCPDDRLVHDRVVLFPYSYEQKKYDPDHLSGLVQEVIPDHSVLVFCHTKKNCENVAELLCRSMTSYMTEHKKESKQSLLEALLLDGGGQVCPTLQKTIPYGVAYHHSGLTMDERKLIEEAYSEGTLCLLCCTSTLAAGVNLPAKRVILRSPYIGMDYMTRSQYKQMVGRAGRAGLDTSGESILIVQKKDKVKVLDLVSGPCESCHSSLLYMDGKGVKSLLLNIIGLKVTESEESVIEFLRKSLCYIQNHVTNLEFDLIKLVTQSLNNLVEKGLIAKKQVLCDVTQEEVTLLEVTKLGRATYKGSVDIDVAPQLLRDLTAAQESLCVRNYLHLLYLVTPYDMVDNLHLNWMTYLDEVSYFNESEEHVANLIGVTESYVSRKATGQRIRNPIDEYPVRRFYLTLILYNLWKEKSIWEVAHKFRMSRGFVQQLLNGAAAFASCVKHFCQELEEFWAYQDLMNNFVMKLSYCVTMELIPLMEIPGVKIGRARQLYNAGYKTLKQVAYAKASELSKNITFLSKKLANQIVESAQMLLQEKAESLRDEAEEIDTKPVKPQGANLSQASSASDSENLSQDEIPNQPISASDSEQLLQEGISNRPISASDSGHLLQEEILNQPINVLHSGHLSDIGISSFGETLNPLSGAEIFIPMEVQEEIVIE